MKSFGLIVVVLALLWPQVSFAHDVCFDSDKTTHCMTDPFSDYWEQNGGLPVFGYPITTQTSETNPDTGEMYPTQWLERNRFEYHQENKGTPYAILLGLLGKERLAQLGRNWAAEPRAAGAQNGCLWFEQTGHNVCNQDGSLGFQRYWLGHGLDVPGLDSYARSLQLFGLPLTEPKIEINSSGDTVLTQWFERARFEWHPKNPNEFKVLLGLLGKEVLDNKGPIPVPAPGPGPIPVPPPAPEPQPTPAAPAPSYNNCQEDALSAPEWPVVIVSVAKSASPEMVTIKNVSSQTVNLDGWRICSMKGNQLHSSLSGQLEPGASKVVTSQAGSAIWNNSSKDDGLLYDNLGRRISVWNDPAR